MKAMAVRALLLSTVFLAASALAQQAPAPSPAPATSAPAAPRNALTPEDFKKLCNTISMAPADGRETARRAECVLTGVLPSPNRLAEARGLAKGAMAAGEPSGGLILFMAFQADPANQFLRDGKVDAEAYRKLGARTVAERQEQIDAIEALGFAAGRNHIGAAVMLAGYFHDTVAPRNVSRVGALTALVMRAGERSPLMERYAAEADTIARVAGNTKASVRAFLQTHQQAVAAARAGYQAQSGGKSCEKPQLKSVSSGEIEGAEYLPLQGTMVKDSYLMRGQWPEYWTFQACDQEVPVKVVFTADGWGGATSTVSHNKGG